MEDKHLHIISLDVPYPPDYGGVIDIFYKIKALHEEGIKISLHCFEYGRGEQPELNKYCLNVTYYSRKHGHKGFSHKLPYIVCSRSNDEMLENLLKDDHPILIEGVHCSYLLNDERFQKRKVILRLHNTEYEYYHKLCQAETSIIKKIYYWHESKLLKQYEKRISGKAMILAMSEEDVSKYKNEFSVNDIDSLPAFIPPAHLRCKQNNGCYCLYHGNLSVAENEKAVIWLLEEVFNDLPLPFVIAGKKPSARLERVANQHPQACIVADPSEEEMQDIIEKAQLHVLPSFNCTGIKLKLLNALFNGRHCIVNREAVESTGLENICHIGSDADSFKKIIEKEYHQPFLAEEIEKRRDILLNLYDNKKNAQQLIQWIW